MVILWMVFLMPELPNIEEVLHFIQSRAFPFSIRPLFSCCEVKNIFFGENLHDQISVFLMSPTSENGMKDELRKKDARRKASHAAAIETERSF